MNKTGIIESSEQTKQQTTRLRSLAALITPRAISIGSVGKKSDYRHFFSQ